MEWLCCFGSIIRTCKFILAPPNQLSFLPSLHLSPAHMLTPSVIVTANVLSMALILCWCISCIFTCLLILGLKITDLVSTYWLVSFSILSGHPFHQTVVCYFLLCSCTNSSGKKTSLCDTPLPNFFLKLDLSFMIMIFFHPNMEDSSIIGDKRLKYESEDQN